MGWVKLTPEQRWQRIRNQRCLYCGQQGHFLIYCPHLFVRLNNLPVFQLDKTIKVLAIDGKLLVNVNHKTKPNKLALSGNHHEPIKLNVISSPLTPIVLNLSFLKTHNSHIDWATTSTQHWSDHCLLSAIPDHSPYSLEPPEGIDLTNVSSEYNDLKDAFSKDRALSLPPHQPYDCAIDLLPGLSLPTKRLYNLSKPEREAMEKYINDSRAAGLICPSSLPVRAGVFFVEKDNTLRGRRMENCLQHMLGTL